jgi:hypothetical protein
MVGVRVKAGVEVERVTRGMLQAARTSASSPAARRQKNFGLEGVIGKDYTNEIK